MAPLPLEHKVATTFDLYGHLTPCGEDETPWLRRMLKTSGRVGPQPLM